MRGHARHAHLDVEDAVAAHLDAEVRGLEHDRERRAGQLRKLRQHAPEAVLRRRALLGVVEDAREVEAQRRRAERVHEREHHRDARLHVGRADPVQEPAVAAGLRVPLRRHRVEVPGQHDEPRARDVARPPLAHARFDERGDRGLVPGDAGDVHEGGEQSGDGLGGGDGGQEGAPCIRCGAEGSTASAARSLETTVAS